MEILSANEAKTHFGDMLLKVQRTPVQINKNDKPVAVVISIDEYEHMEALKLRLLQNRAAKARKAIRHGDTIDGESFFDALLSGKYDDKS